MRLTLIGLSAIALALFNSSNSTTAAAGGVWYKVCTKAALAPWSVDVEPGDICQTVAADSKTSALVGQVAVRRLPGQTDYQLETFLPLNKLFALGVTLQVDSRQVIKLAYRRCSPLGCIAGATVGEWYAMQMRAG